MKLKKKIEVIIQAGGRGSRLRHYTWNKPKCLVSYEGKPLIYHLFNKLKNANFHIIADYKIDQIKKYFEINKPNVKYKIYSTKETGTCAGIQKVLNNITDNKEILILWSDLIIDKIPIFNKNSIVVTTSSFTCRWAIRKKKIIEKTSSKKGIPGIFYFKNKQFINKIPKSGEFVKWLSKNLPTFSTIELNELKELGDFSKVEKSYNKIGYGRYFNKLIIKKNYIIKKAIDKNFNHLIENELNWYEEVDKLGYKDIPKILSQKPLKIERIKGQHLFEYKNLKTKSLSKIIENILKSLYDLHNKNEIDSILTDLKEVYINKTINRLNSISKIIPNFSTAESFTINGKKCKNFLMKKNSSIFNEIYKKIINKKFNPIHGDPTFSNILIKKNLKPKFFDPRGYFANSKNIFGDKYYDYSKVYYSLVGNYDLFNRRKFKLYIDNYSIELMMDNNHQKIGEEIFKSHFGSKINKIKIIHSLIWLSLSGYVKDDIDSILASFYNGIYWMNDALN